MIKDLLKKNKLLKVIYFMLFIMIFTFIIEVIARGSFYDSFEFFKHHFKAFIFNSLIILLTISPMFVFRRKVFITSLISSLWLILSIANNVLMNLRGTPLTGADMSMIKNALDLSTQYLSFISILLIIVLFISLFALLFLLYKKAPKGTVNYKIALPLTIVFVLFFPRITDHSLKNNVITRNYWDIIGGYGSYGFSYSFLNSVFNTGIDKPENYSKEEVINLKDKLDSTEEATSTEPEVKPNVIFVQLESFMDPLWINNTTYNKDPMPNFRELSNDYSSGLLFVPSFGGGTANTEFEVITGMSTDFFAPGEYPFNTVLSSSEALSSAHYFKNLGYSTHALHNHEGTFYNRYKVYKNLGFNTFTSLELMNVHEPTRGGWAKDAILTDEIKTLITSTEESDFVYAVSVQGHGGYPNTPLDDLEITVDCDYENKYSIEYYVNLVYEMDKFVGDLIEMVNSLNEPSVVVFYGDHLPSLGIGGDNITTNNSMATPYVIWDNIGLEKSDKDMQAYELMTNLIYELNYPTTTLNKLHNSNISDEDKRNALNLLEYDILYGKNYINNNGIPVNSSDFKFGIKRPAVTDIIIEDALVIIKGENFNKFSKVFINNKSVDTKFVDSSTLSINEKDFKDNTDIKVNQVSNSGVNYTN